MEFSAGSDAAEPVSPTGQYFTSSVISVSVICVLESERTIDIDDSHTIALLRDVFLPINSRFSSIMETDKKGKKQWRKVEVKLQDHINTPIFPEGQSPEYYEDCFSQYLSELALKQLPQTRPLWELHLVKYRTKNAASTVIFKLHHALGDGFSLMGALLSCLQRAENPEMPLTFPLLSKKTTETNGGGLNVCKNVPKVILGVLNTISDFGWSLMKSSFLEDGKTPIRSGGEGVEFRPITISTLTFSLDQIKQIRTTLHVTVNDVICGVLFLGVRLYMQEMNYDLRNAQSTSLVLLNTRNVGGYRSISEMVNRDSESPWGNQFAFLHVSVPKFTDQGSFNPLDFVLKAKKTIKRKRDSAAVVLTGKLLETLRKYRGPEVTAKYIHSTLKNTSMTISNIIGPVERMALANHPCKGLYFMVVGVPQNLTITMMSYMGHLRVAVGTEDGLIDARIFKSCVQKSFDTILKAAVASPNGIY